MTATDTTHSGQLAVYGTNGEEFYPAPDEGGGHPEVSDWFLTTGLRCSLNLAEQKLVVYLGDVRHPHHLDQVFAVYKQAVDSENYIVEDCRAAVKRELEKEKGWELVETTSTTDAKSMYHHLVRTGQSRQISKIQLSDYTHHEKDLINDVLKSEKTDPIHVHASDYRVASQLVHSYSQIDAIRIDIYNERSPQIPRETDLAISVELGPYEVKIPEACITLLDKWKQKRERIQARNRMDATVKALTTHAENDDDITIVQEAIEEGLQEQYGEYNLVERDEHESLKRELSNKQERLSRQTSEIDSLQEELESERRRADRLKKDAALIHRIRQLKHAIRHPLSIFIKESEDELDGRKTYKNTDGGQKVVAANDNTASRGGHSDSGKQILWNRVAVVVLTILIAILIVHLFFFPILETVWNSLEKVWQNLPLASSFSTGTLAVPARTNALPNFSTTWENSAENPYRG